MAIELVTVARSCASRPLSRVAGVPVAVALTPTSRPVASGFGAMLVTSPAVTLPSMCRLASRSTSRRSWCSVYGAAMMLIVTPVRRARLTSRLTASGMAPCQ
jgi:hypothetical protein